MKKLLSIVAVLVATVWGISYADSLGIEDTVSETTAKTQASGLGITQIYDHPSDVPTGSYVVPVEYNRTTTEGNGTEVDSNDSKKNDIDYIPLSQLKGDKGDTGATGATGVVGTIEANGGTNGSTSGSNALNFTGTGLTVNNTGGTANVNLSNLQTTQGTQNTTAINTLNSSISNVYNSAVGASNSYTDYRVNNEAFTRATEDNTLQNEITSNDNSSRSRDTTLQNNINNETTNRINGDKLLQTEVDATNGRVDGLNTRVNNLESQVHKLGETKYIGEGDIRLYDSKKWAVHVFDSYDFRHQHNDEIGARLTYKLGKSYEEKRLDDLDRKVLVASLKRTDTVSKSSEDVETRRLLAEQSKLLKEQQEVIKGMQAQLSSLKVASEKKAVLRLKNLGE